MALARRKHPKQSCENGLLVYGMQVQRSLQPVLERRAGASPVVVLTGPRQSGKTTLVPGVFSAKPYANSERVTQDRGPAGAVVNGNEEVIVADEDVVHGRPRAGDAPYASRSGAGLVGVNLLHARVRSEVGAPPDAVSTAKFPAETEYLQVNLHQALTP